MRISQYIRLVYFALPLVGGSLHAQHGSDTMKRELRVQTDEDIVLPSRSALPISLTIPVPDMPARSSSYQKVPLPIKELQLSSPLAALPPLLPNYRASEQRGYVYLSGGLQYNGYLQAGYRPLNDSTKLLDLQLSGLLSNFDLNQPYHRGLKAKDHEIYIGGDYKHKFERSTLRIHANYRGRGYNYYGFYYPGIPDYEGLGHLPSDIYVGNSSSTFPHPEDKGAMHTISLAGDYSWSNNRWIYLLGFDVDWAQVRRKEAHSNAYTPSEAIIDVRGSLEYLFSEENKAGAKAFIRSFNRRILNTSLSTYSPAVYSIAPYWHINREMGSGINWDLHLGLGIDILSDAPNASSFLYPQVETSLTNPEHWTLKFTADGGTINNSIPEVSDLMPYYDCLSYVPMSQVPYRIELQGSILLSPQIELHTGLQYEYIKNAANFAPYTTFAYNNSYNIPEQVVFKSYTTQLRHFSVAGGVEYRSLADWGLSADLKIHKYSTEEGDILTSHRPTIELGAKWKYHPLEALHLYAGYSMLYGIKYYALSNKMSESQTAINLLHLGASYTLNSTWSLSLNTQYNLQKDARRYSYYPLQRFALNVGANYNF